MNDEYKHLVKEAWHMISGGPFDERDFLTCVQDLVNANESLSAKCMELAHEVDELIAERNRGPQTRGEFFYE